MNSQGLPHSSVTATLINSGCSPDCKCGRHHIMWWLSACSFCEGSKRHAMCSWLAIFRAFLMAQENRITWWKILAELGFNLSQASLSKIVELFGSAWRFHSGVNNGRCLPLQKTVFCLAFQDGWPAQVRSRTPFGSSRTLFPEKKAEIEVR